MVAIVLGCRSRRVRLDSRIAPSLYGFGLDQSGLLSGNGCRWRYSGSVRHLRYRIRAPISCLPGRTRIIDTDTLSVLGMWRILGDCGDLGRSDPYGDYRYPKGRSDDGPCHNARCLWPGPVSNTSVIPHHHGNDTSTRLVQPTGTQLAHGLPRTGPRDRMHPSCDAGERTRLQSPETQQDDSGRTIARRVGQRACSDGCPQRHRRGTLARGWRGHAFRPVFINYKPHLT